MKFILKAIIISFTFLVTGAAGITADFSADTTAGSAPLTVSFTDLSSGSPTGWAWFFGDENYAAPWTLMNASPGWKTRDGQSSVAMPDGSIVLMGGNPPTNDVWRSTDNGATWTQMTANAMWMPRYGQSSVAMPGGSIVLMGGVGNGIKNDVWRSTDYGATWTLANASPGWTARYGHTSVVMPDGSIVLIGGYANEGVKNDVWRSTDYGATWTQITANAGWSPRWGHSSVAMPDGSIVLMGGQSSTAGFDYHYDVWRSTDNGATWTLMTPYAGWSSRSQHTSVAMPDGSIVLMGGAYYSNSLNNEIWRSTDNGAIWTQITPHAGWSARYGHSNVAMPDGSIVLMGGSVGGSRTNDTWRFMPIGSSQQNPSHVYLLPGPYQVSLQAYNADGYASTRKTGFVTITIPTAPEADFVGVPTSGIAPLTVQFNDTSTGYPAIWNWSYGDSTWFNTSTSSLRNASHAYTNVGTYSVTLTVSNSVGNDIKTNIGYITVLGLDPTVTGITPATGVNTTSVSITNLAGMNFNTTIAPTVKLNRTGYSDIPATGVTVVDSTNITCTLPITYQPAGLWNVVVTNPDGQDGMLVDGYTITAPIIVPTPIVTGITPATGVNTSSVSITNLAGTAFYGTPAVNLTKDGQNNITAIGVSVVDSTNITCSFDLTGKTAGLWDVVVTNPDGQEAKLTDGFEITTSLISTDIGVFRSGQWILDYGMDGTVNRRFQYGLATDTPIVGDFNNDGTSDIGVFRSGQWILDYGIDRVVDRRFNYGIATDKPVEGDFNNDGTMDIGVFRSGQWILDYGMDGSVNRRFQYGQSGDNPVKGDFNNDGKMDTGVYRSGQWIMDYGIDGTVDRRLQYGLGIDNPVVGDFNNDGTTDIGVFRSGQWILNYGMDGTVDRRFNYGIATDIPIVGKWV